MRIKKAVVLFEVMLAVLISVIIAVYLFRAFGKFSQGAGRSRLYLDYAQCAGQAWTEFQLNSSQTGICSDNLTWTIEEELCEDSEYLVKEKLTIRAKDSKAVFDTLRSEFVTKDNL